MPWVRSSTRPARTNTWPWPSQARDREAEAVNSWTRALAGARATGYLGLEGVVLMNLGVASEALGRRQQSLAYFEQSVKLNETLGDERQAARAQVNAAAILVEYGRAPTTASAACRAR